jgi:hypothetical protein
VQETALRTCSRYMGMTSKRDGDHLVSRIIVLDGSGYLLLEEQRRSVSEILD